MAVHLAAYPQGLQVVRSELFRDMVDLQLFTVAGQTQQLGWGKNSDHEVEFEFLTAVHQVVDQYVEFLGAAVEFNDQQANGVQVQQQQAFQKRGCDVDFSAALEGEPAVVLSAQFLAVIGDQQCVGCEPVFIGRFMNGLLSQVIHDGFPVESAMST